MGFGSRKRRLDTAECSRMKSANGLILVGVASTLLAVCAGVALPRAAVEQRALGASTVTVQTAEPTPSFPVVAAPTPVATASPAASSAPPEITPPLGYDEAPELALAVELGLTPEQAEAVGQVMRECDAELDREMLELMRVGYDDVVAKQIGQRHEARVVKRVEEALPPEARLRFRSLLARVPTAKQLD
jgi:hypothetical protein